MIAYVRGILAEKMEDSVIVEAGGLGYRIFVPVSVLSELPKVGETVKIFTYYSVKEDSVSLYGFLAKHDLEMFRMLIGVNGIGPKSALGILSAMSPDALRMAILSGDAKAISKAPGVGSKTAQRIILDLKDKVNADDILYGVTDMPAKADVSDVSGIGGVGKEAIEALHALGYTASEASGAVKKVTITETMTVEDVLKAALRHLAFI